MIWQSSWDDGSTLDLRIAEMLEKYGLPGTFYVHGDRHLPWVAVRELAKTFKIGSHTMTHPENLRFLTEEFLFFEINTSKEVIQNVLSGVQDTCDTFAYPSGKYNAFVAAKVKEAGYKEARTVMVFCTDLDWRDKPFDKPTTIHVYDGRKEYEGQKWDVLARKFLEEAIAKGENGYFHLWGHADEINKYGDWQRLDAFLAYAADRLKGVDWRKE